MRRLARWYADHAALLSILSWFYALCILGFAVGWFLNWWLRW